MCEFVHINSHFFLRIDPGFVIYPYLFHRTYTGRHDVAAKPPTALFIFWQTVPPYSARAMRLSRVAQCRTVQAHRVTMITKFPPLILLHSQ
jgi:hypothetical protein